MNVKNEIQLEILANGVVQVLMQIIYLRDDETEIVRDNWRCILNPGEIEEAEQLLDEYHMGIIRSVWTKEVISKYEKTKDTTLNSGVFL